MQKAAVFILLGQSNAVGHGVPMAQEDKITEPMQNVFGLSRTWNQSYDNTALTWSGYTSAGMNLAETQDDTWSMANALAKQWQAEIDGGNPHALPDLYIVHIAIGAQGVTKDFMWYPRREKKLIPGPLGTVDISLFPFTTHILSVVDASIRALGKEPEHMGIFWKGGEEEGAVQLEEYFGILPGIYDTLFDGFFAALGHEVPVYLYRICHFGRMAQFENEDEHCARSSYVNQTLWRLSQNRKGFTWIDPRTCPLHDPALPNSGLFEPDLVHYQPAVNRWFAAEALRRFCEQRQSN